MPLSTTSITSLICSNYQVVCSQARLLPVIIFYIVIGLLALIGLLSILAHFIPQVEIVKSKIILPLAKKRAFNKLSNLAIKSDIKGHVNSSILKISKLFPEGWLKPMDFEWVESENRTDFLNENEIVVRIRPLKNQDLNFVIAVYYFLRKSFFPKTKNVIPGQHYEASVLFVSQQIVDKEKPGLKELFEEHILEKEVSKDVKILDVLVRYKNIDNRGFFLGAFLREVHAVANEARFTPMRSKMRQEVNEILKHMEEFLKLYAEQAKSGTKTIPSDMWHRLGPVTNYGFILVARPIKTTIGTAAYVNRAREYTTKGVDRLYLFGSNAEIIFANKVIDDISHQVPELQLIERFALSNDYRGNKGGIGALFIKRQTV